jgi:hypothetical protein
MWKAYQRGEEAPRGSAPWWNLFAQLEDLRPWGPEDRLGPDARAAIEELLPLDPDEEVQLELEIFPSASAPRRERWRSEARARVQDLDGRVIHASSIVGDRFIYEALLVGLPASEVRALLANPHAPGGLATLDGLQFILPQTVAQAIPDTSEEGDGRSSSTGAPDPEAPYRVALLDGTPVAAHRELDGGVTIEDVHDLVRMSQVRDRKHATSMASLILRGDLVADGVPLEDSRVLSIPILIDGSDGTQSPRDRLFVDIVHVALTKLLEGAEPLGPDVFVVNFSVGIFNSMFAGRISALGRLLDWWAAKSGVLFVVSAGNILEPLLIDGTTTGALEDAPPHEQVATVQRALRDARHGRTLLAPAEAINVLTVGAASQDLAETQTDSRPGFLHPAAPQSAALPSAAGPGHLGAIKPDVLAPGGSHPVRILPSGDGVHARVPPVSRLHGLHVAAPGETDPRRSSGTSCAAALTTRALVRCVSSLTDQGGPFAGLELPRTDAALLARALAVNSAQWGQPADELLAAEKERIGSRKHSQAKQEVARYYGHGLMDVDRMIASPESGVTLVGLGTLRPDAAAVFELPLPESIAGQKVGRSMRVTVAWFSPVDSRRSRYRLASLEAIAAASEDDDIDKGWALKLASDRLDSSMIKRGSVWSRRLTHSSKTVPAFDENSVIPVRVQCFDAGGLDPDAEVRFALAITLEVESEIESDIFDEVRSRLQVRPRGASGA